MMPAIHELTEDQLAGAMDGLSVYVSDEGRLVAGVIAGPAVTARALLARLDKREPARAATLRTLDGRSARAYNARNVHVADDRDQDGRRALCGLRPVTPVARQAPHPLPEGREWCGKCLMTLAYRTGRLGDVARLLGAEGDGDG